MNLEDAFNELREAILNSMISFCRDAEAAEDGVSHAFTQALKNKHMLESMPEAAMKAWLYATARNAIVDIKRRQSRLVYLGFDIPVEDDFTDELLDKNMAEELLEKLPEELRLPLSLKYYGGLNSTEIGREMELNAATVRTRIRAAMKKLRETKTNSN